MFGNRRWHVPEELQLSAIDCGPAALVAILRGIGIGLDSVKVREWCHTGVEGTSIDDLEDLAVALGAPAMQVLIPREHVLEEASAALPSIAVVCRHEGALHFVVLWRRVGPYVQVMDPGVGRRWMRVEQLVEELYEHELAVPASMWEEMASSPEFLGSLATRLRSLGCSAAEVQTLVGRAEKEGPNGVAALDCAARVSAAVPRRAGRAAESVTQLFGILGDEPAAAPEHLWTARPRYGADVRLRGAILLTVRESSGQEMSEAETTDAAVLRAELAGEPARPWLTTAALVWGCDRARTVRLALWLAVAGILATLELVVLRHVIDAGAASPSLLLRFWLLGVGLVVAEALLLREGTALGRNLELRLRRMWDEALPGLADEFVQTRPATDLAERAHQIHHMRELAHTVVQLARLVCFVVPCAVAVALAVPGAAPAVAVLTAVSIGGAVAVVRFLQESDVQQRTQGARLARWHYEVRRGAACLAPGHGKSAVVAVAHEASRDWEHAARRFHRTGALAGLVHGVASFGIAATFVVSLAVRGQHDAATIFFAGYLAVIVPYTGQRICILAQTLPRYGSVLVRLTEPLRAPKRARHTNAPLPAEPILPQGAGVSLRLRKVRAKREGREVLHGVDVNVDAGEHLAVVGPSGSGKSSLAGLLLGWLSPSAGHILVDGHLLSPDVIAELSTATAWVAAEVRVWDVPLEANVAFGNGADRAAVLDALSTAGAGDVLDRLGLDGQRLGEGAAALTSTEAQRVRFARALALPSPRLVVLDEAFRGLDTAERRRCLSIARNRWRCATLLHITHDTAEAELFDRVLVVEDGSIVEDGTPAVLRSIPDGHFSALVAAEISLRRRQERWERYQMDQGRVTHVPPRRTMRQP